MSEDEATRPGRRYDPERRDRIVDVCLDVIAEVGVAGLSHRKVAAAADVPLGSMTYHFAGLDELLHEAFTRFSRTMSDRFEQRLAAAPDLGAAARAVAEIITLDTLRDQRELVLTQELYTLAARDPGYRRITNAWMLRSRAALERHFDPATARLLDALIEGLSLHRALGTEAPEPGAAADAVSRITGLRPSGP